MAIWENFKQLIKEFKKTKKKRAKIYKKSFDDEYEKELKKKAKVDAYNKVNKKNTSESMFGSSKMTIGMFENGNDNK